MPVEIDLHTATTQIRNALESRLETLQATLLSDFKTIVIGDRARVGVLEDPPFLWALPDQARTVELHALQEVWEWPFALIAFTKGDDPEADSLEAMRLANLARVGALKYDDDSGYRKLGLAFVNDLQSISFEPARPTPIDNRLLYSAAAVIQIRFTILERTTI